MVDDFVPRHIGSVIRETAVTFPIVLVTGPRQVGKTTLLKQLYPDIPYETLDRLDTLDSARDEPERFLRMLSEPAIIDEVQYAPNLFRYLKIIVDEQPRRKGRILLTGSQRFQMMQGLDESLAGRVGIVEMLGLSLREMLHDSFGGPFIPTETYVAERNPMKGASERLWDIIFRGDMPELFVDSAMSAVRYYDAYIETYLRRDVRDLAHVGELSRFNRFMGLVADLHGKILNKTDLANKADVSFQTVERWLSVLESSSLIYLLRPFAANTSKRLTKAPKLYFLNSGLVARLKGYESATELEKSRDAGAFFEGFVVAEVVKSFLNVNGIMPALSFYRDSNGNEIDLIIEKGGELYPVEIKKAEIARETDSKAFSQLDAFADYDRKPGVVICQTRDRLPMKEGAWALPVTYL